MKYCISCTSTFECTECMQGYSIIDGKCLNMPYNYNPSNLAIPAVNIVFDVFQEYFEDLFQNGMNSTTYAPYNNPENDDPHIYISRGIYLTGPQYLMTRNDVNFTLNYQFTVAF